MVVLFLLLVVEYGLFYNFVVLFSLVIFIMMIFLLIFVLVFLGIFGCVLFWLFVLRILEMEEICVKKKGKILKYYKENCFWYKIGEMFVKYFV